MTKNASDKCSTVGASFIMRDFFNRLGILGELLQFMWRRKLYWLLPMMLTLLVFAVFVLLSSAGGIAPFIYSIF
jgi:Ca2+/Na+ antiporter